MAVWESKESSSRIPFAVYTDEQLHQRELERLFYRGHWCYVGLEAEIPNVGDFKRTVKSSAWWTRSKSELLIGVAVSRKTVLPLQISCIRHQREPHGLCSSS